MLSYFLTNIIRHCYYYHCDLDLCTKETLVKIKQLLKDYILNDICNLIFSYAFLEAEYDCVMHLDYYTSDVTDNCYMILTINDYDFSIRFEYNSDNNNFIDRSLDFSVLYNNTEQTYRHNIIKNKSIPCVTCPIFPIIMKDEKEEYFFETGHLTECIFRDIVGHETIHELFSCNILSMEGTKIAPAIGKHTENGCDKFVFSETNMMPLPNTILDQCLSECNTEDFYIIQECKNAQAFDRIISTPFNSRLCTIKNNYHVRNIKKDNIISRELYEYICSQIFETIVNILN